MTKSKPSRMPVLFVGHGSPMNAIEDNPWSRGFRQLADLDPDTQGHSLRVSALVRARDVHDRQCQARNDSRLRRIPQGALREAVPGARRPGAGQTRNRAPRRTACQGQHRLGSRPRDLERPGPTSTSSRHPGRAAGDRRRAATRRASGAGPIPGAASRRGGPVDGKRKRDPQPSLCDAQQFYRRSRRPPPGRPRSTPTCSMRQNNTMEWRSSGPLKATPVECPIRPSITFCRYSTPWALPTATIPCAFRLRASTSDPCRCVRSSSAEASSQSYRMVTSTFTRLRKNRNPPAPAKETFESMWPAEV